MSDERPVEVCTRCGARTRKGLTPVPYGITTYKACQGCTEHLRYAASTRYDEGPVRPKSKIVMAKYPQEQTLLELEG